MRTGGGLRTGPPPRPPMPGKHTNIGAKRARQARERWGLGPAEPLPCVVTCAEREEGLPVVVMPMPEHIAGALTGEPVAFVNGRHAVVRMRFTVAHELGHHLMGHGDRRVDSVDVLRTSRDPQEVEANAFAAELLVPRAAVEALVSGTPGLEDVVRLACAYGTSALAAAYRLTTLGLVGAARARQLAAELEEGLHHTVRDHLGLEDATDDLLCGLGPDDLPRVPPALHGTALDALLRGRADAATVAAVAGVDPAALASGATEALRPL